MKPGDRVKHRATGLRGTIRKGYLRPSERYAMPVMVQFDGAESSHEMKPQDIAHVQN